MRPSKLCELETIVSLLERAHEENEACNESFSKDLSVQHRAPKKGVLPMT